ncbi:MAG: hypothetical protein JWQ27_1801 [Ferruginibacter sp.]|nr:hypothetical protein [Ferruginibacter sp.]
MPAKKNLTVYLLIFFVSFAVLTGSSYNTYLSYERFYNPDSETYTNTAKFHFKDQSLIRKYRVIVPTLANIASLPLEKIYYKIVKDHRDKYDWPLLTGFFIVNALLMSLAAVVIFKIMRFQGLGLPASVIGLAAFLTGGRWASFLTGHPATDSLTILCIALIVYSMLKPNRFLLAAGIVIGLLSKESTALFFPMIMILLPGKQRWWALVYMVVAFALYFGLKAWIDALSGTTPVASINEGLDTFNSVKDSLLKLFSVKGIADMFSVYGFFNLFLLTGLFSKTFRENIWSYLGPLFWLFLLTIIAHMLLSMELARMFYLGSALFIPLIAKSFELHPLVIKMKKENYDQQELPAGHLNNP